MKIQDTNYAVLTGVLVNKSRNANSNDIKRPVLDIEIIREQDGNLFFETFPVVACEIAVVKSIMGLKIGDIVTTQGTVRHMDNGNLYLEADEVSRIRKAEIGEDKTVEYALSRMKLVQTSPRFNLSILLGEIVGINKEESMLVLKVPRSTLSRGNLITTDIIKMKLPKHLQSMILHKGNKVLCIGELGGVENTFFYPNSIRLIETS